VKKAIGLDYGQKRVGVSISDSSQIIATGLTTVINQNIFHFLNNLFLEEEIDTIVVGYSKNLDGTDSDISTEIENFICKLNSNYPTKKIRTVDERFTSKIAFRSMIDSGVKKQKRRKKSLIDEVSATIILQDYLSYK
tara:strand:+ start:108 stop:518 length:411 start_codon:yes stop_codon:yes gene_type:complete